MKIKELVKKGLVLGLVLALTGVFFGCKNNDDDSSSGYYTVKYKTYILADAESKIDDSEIAEFTEAGLKTPADYSISGKTITFTDSGFDKFLEIMGEETGMGDITNIVIYNNKMVMPISAQMFLFFGSKLELNTDYTIDANDTRFIILTPAGYEKAAELMRQMGGDDDE